MSGIDIIGALLEGDTAFKAAVQPSNFKAGMLPENAGLPSVLVRLVSSTDWNLIDGKPSKTTDRIAVTVRVGRYADVEPLLRIIRDACAGAIGAVGGATGVSVLTAGGSPDLIGPGATFERTQDFRVTFDA